ncbi:unnamed protein product [Clonostachys rosea]|uniref:Uncharacterized protein n=1 Tax=Bionectria ochroleuca TaxID=29856 RepID=A0ABY6UI94_BIOOC|nr:unnamed protein product [Clonostachys rosea]
MESPWGKDALLIKTISTAPHGLSATTRWYHEATVTKGKLINFYCVNCGVTGSLEMAGNVTIDGLRGIKDGKVVGTIEISVGLGLGIYAQHTIEHAFTKDLYDIPISPFTVGFATVGPMLSIGTEMKFHYNHKTKNMSYTNFKPEFIPSFAAEGSVTLAAQFGVPLGLEVGLTFFSSCEACKGSIGIATTPSIIAAATVAVEASGNLTVPISSADKAEGVTKKLDAGIKPVNNCTGISTTISVRNDLAGKFEGFGLVKKDWALHKTPDYILASYCIGGNKTDGTSRGRTGWQGPADGGKKDKRSISAGNLESLHESEVVSEQLIDLTERDESHEFYDLTEYIVEEIEQVDFNEASLSATPYALSDDEFKIFWFSSLSVDGDDSHILAACNDGNVYVQKDTVVNNLPWHMTCTTLNTMSVVGVSRLRYTDEEHVPGTSVYVGLAPYYYDDDDSQEEPRPSMLVAVDKNDNILFPAVCTYKDGQGAKIYVIGEDIEAGLAMLESPDVKYTITNGDVDKCNLLLLSVTSPVDGAWSEYDDDARANYNADPLEYEFEESLFNQDQLNLPDSLLDADDDRFTDLDVIWDDDWFGEDLDLLDGDLSWLNGIE